MGSLKLLLCLLCFLYIIPTESAKLYVCSRLQADVSRYPRLKAALEFQAQLEAPGEEVIVVGHGSNIGSADPISKIGGEIPGSLALNGINMQVTTFSNHDFDQGLDQLRYLLPGWEPQVAVYNVGIELPRTSPYVLRTLKSGLVVAFVGVLSSSARSVMDQTIVNALNITEVEDSTGLIAGQMEAAAAGATYFVAMLDSRLQSPDEVDAFVEPFANAFDVILLGLASGQAFQREVNGTLVVSSSEEGRGFAVVSIPGGTAEIVAVTSATEPDPSASLELDVWTSLATCKGSAKTGVVDAYLWGRQQNTGANGLRYCRASENALNTIVLQGMMRLTGARVAIINTGAVRDNLPSSFVPDPTAGLVRPGGDALNSSFSIAGYDLATGDCNSVSPFGNELFVQWASSAELYQILLWTANGDTEPQIARQMQGAVLGMKYRIAFRADLTQVISDVTFADTGEPLDPTITNDRHLVALTSFISSGGDGFPIITSSAPESYNATDREVLCSELAYLSEETERGKDDSIIKLDDLLPFQVIVTREEQICSSFNGNYVLELQKGNRAQVNAADWEQVVPFANTTRCVNMSLTSLSPTFFDESGLGLTSVSTVLAPPNEYSVVQRRDGLIVGQIVGYPINLTLDSMDPDFGKATVFRVRVCMLEARFIPVYGRFSVPGIAISENGNYFREAPDADVAYEVDAISNVGYYCGTIAKDVSGGSIVIAPSRVLASSTFSVVEQVFLVLFGVVYLGFAFYAFVLLIHHFLLTKAMYDKPTLEEMINPALVVRIELVLVGLCRFLYFVLLPFDVFAVNVLGGYFLFEFPFILDFSIYSTFIQLFITVFHWRKLRSIEKRYLWVPLLTVNVVLFLFFFAVVIVYGVSPQSSTQSAMVLAYHIALAALAFCVVIVFAIYGTVLLLRVRAAVKAGNSPSWLPQMQRLTVVTALATAGILAIFIVIIYNSTITVPDPVLSSTPWVICFLFFAELLPLFGILNDLHRTALVNQEAAFPKSTERKRSVTRTGGLSFSMSARSSIGGGPPRKGSAPTAPEKKVTSGEVFELEKAAEELDSDFTQSQVEIH